MAQISKPAPEIQFKTPTYSSRNEDVDAETTGSKPSSIRQRGSNLAGDRSSRPATPQDIYLGSYAHTSPRGSTVARASSRTPPTTPKESTRQFQLEHLLPQLEVDLNTYGLEELRDGFFDAVFYRPLKRRRSDLMRRASKTLPQSFQEHHPLSLRRFLPQQLHEVRGFLGKLRTRAGIKLLKSFLGVFISYVICLIPVSRDWLGRYNHVIVISAIVNHPGRTFGSQIDGTFLTIFGTIAGLAWGSLALYVSTSTVTAQRGYGGILATFLVIFTASIGWLRCVFLRFYQAVISAGIAICYICLANTSETVGWRKLFDYGIPWVLGQAICLVVASVVFPDAGARSLGLAVHGSIETITEGLQFPRQESPSIKRDLAWHFVKLSEAARDFTIDLTFSHFQSDDVLVLRNLLQGVIRSILAIKPDTALFDVIPMESEDLDGVDLIRRHLSEPTRRLLAAMKNCLHRADVTILRMAGLQTEDKTKQETLRLKNTLAELVESKQVFDAADALLIDEKDISMTIEKDTAAVQLFLFVHPVRQAADRVEALASHVSEMQQSSKTWRIQPPSYPWRKAVMRTNVQVRHDRGGLTAGYYFHVRNQLDRTMADLQSRPFIPAPRYQQEGKVELNTSTAGKGDTGQKTLMQSLRYDLWEVLHRLQGFESRFAFKVMLVTTLVSIPAWLPQSRGWWNTNESWWTVVTVWLMMHPRVGGTMQDLLVRCFCAVIGVTWGALTYRAAYGNPYVMGIFAALFLVPMLHRFSQSSHPRSGFIGCISFAVVSLDIYTSGGQPSVVVIAWTRGLAFVVGIIAAVIVNWLLWPFIARHELRKSLSSTMLHSAILYRGVIAKYVYFADGEEPGPKDIERSEMLEGRLREGFVRMRQLLELTRHEIRLRAPFNPLPYSALISACESFFEHLIQVRQSSLYFQPTLLASDAEAVETLASVRRDAVAVILLNLYILACALRADRPVPRYIPSAAAARKKLLDRMEIVEAGYAARARAEALTKGLSASKRRRWADVYHYAYSSALTDIVEELQQLQRYTKEICGEVDWGGARVL